jgi:hypothetical protein
MDSQSRNNLFKVALALLVVFILFFSFGKISLPGLDFIKKVQLADIFTSKKQRKHITVISDSTKLNELDTVPLLKDSIKIPTTSSTNFKRVFIDSNSGKPTFKYNAEPICDTCKGERVLFVGDSELDGLFKPAHEYCLANGHKLVTSVIWYGSHTRHWAITDTLDYYINKVKPTVVLMALGLNEIFAFDLERRRKYMKTIKAKFEKYNVKYFYIGPAAWVKDNGITNVMEQEFSPNFFPSHIYDYERMKDKRHPSFAASKIWFDSIARKITLNGQIDFSRKYKGKFVPYGPVIMMKLPRF